MLVQDHHKTAAAELTDPSLASVPSLEVHFDMERSGATVRWAEAAGHSQVGTVGAQSVS
jgi:hypothetical protein